MPGQGLLICDAWAGAPAGSAKTHFLVAGDWSATGAGGRDAIGFEQGEARVCLCPIEGVLGDIEPARHWLRFSEARPAHRVTLTPPARSLSPASPSTSSETGVQTAILWIGWGDAEAPTDRAAILRDLLLAAFTAIPAVRGL